MPIQSAFNSGVQGFNRAQEAVSESALAIRSATLNDPAIQQTNSELQDANSLNAPVNPPINAIETENNLTQSPSSQSNEITDLNQELVDLKVAEFQAAASTNVIRTADEVLGTLIDVTA